jgi:hypothetical protein
MVSEELPKGNSAVPKPTSGMVFPLEPCGSSGMLPIFPAAARSILTYFASLGHTCIYTLQSSTQQCCNGPNPILLFNYAQAIHNR